MRRAGIGKHIGAGAAVAVVFGEPDALQAAVGLDVFGNALAAGLHDFLGNHTAAGGGQLFGIQAGGDAFADAGVDAAVLMKEAAAICAAKPKAELLWASCREFYNIIEAEKCGCQIITVPNDILAKSKNYGKDLTAYSLETVQGFYKDASGLGFTIL